MSDVQTAVSSEKRVKTKKRINFNIVFIRLKKC